MKVRNAALAVAVVAATTNCGGSRLRADPPVPNPAAVQPDQGITTIEGLRAQTAPNAAFQIASATYGNPLGIEVDDVGSALRAQLDVEEGLGVVITSVNPESEVAKAGLHVFDIVLKIDEQAITSKKQFHEIVGGLMGKTVQASLLRKGRPATLPVTLPTTLSYELVHVPVALDLAFAEIGAYAATPQYRIGVTLAETDDTLRSQLRLAAGEGLIVTDVVAGSPAAKAGIQKHDVLTRLDGRRLTTVEAANALIQEIKDRSASLALYRAGQEQTLEVAPQLSEETPRAYLGREFTFWLGAHDQLAPLRLTPELQNHHNVILWREGLAGLAGPYVDPAKNAAAEPGATPSVADQVAALKQQLAAIQASLAALEATLNSPPQEKPSPEEK